MHPNLRTAGTLPSLDMPHHLKPTEWCEYREGVTLETASQDGYGVSKKSRQTNGHDGADHSTVDAGLSQQVSVATSIPGSTRVTLRFSKDPPHPNQSLDGEVVSPALPREDSGFYWGYSVRQCSSISTVFTESPFEGGYDASIGTSERGCGLEKVLPSKIASSHYASGDPETMDTPQRLPEQFSHLIIVFGGVAGLEAAASADEALKSQGLQAGDVRQLFDAWVNVCPGQGSRTIRTEEALWLGLGAIKAYVDKCGSTSQ